MILGGGQGVADFSAQAFAGAFVGDRHDEGTDVGLLVVAENRVRTRADLLGRARAVELLAQVREQPREPQLVALALLKPGQWEDLVAQLGKIENPVVPTKPSRFALPVQKKRGSDAHSGE